MSMTDTARASWKDWVVFGGGGATPRVDVWDPVSGEIATLVSLDAGASVYALATDREGARLAVGTKHGDLLLFRNRAGMQGEVAEVELRMRFSQPILSLAFIDLNRIAVATRRETFWINAADTEGACHFLDSSGDAVCALCSPRQGALYGISTTGQVFEWLTPGEDRVRCFPGPRLGPRWAIADLTYWPGEDAMVYGCSNGDIALVSLREQKVVTWSGHKGEIYALSSSDDALVTAGQDDQRLKVWRKGHRDPEIEFACPPGIASVALLGEDASELLLVDEVGRAAVFAPTEGCLRVVHPFRQSSYRALLPPDLSHLRHRRAERTKACLAETVEKAMVCIRGERWDELKEIYAHLNARACVGTALWLRSEQAKAQGDIQAELEARLTLYRTCGPGDPDVRASSEDLAQRLETFWCYREAAEVYEKLASDTSDQHFRRRMAMSLQRFQRASEERAIVDTQDVALEKVLLSAAALSKPCSGRWLIRRHQEYDFPDVSMPAEAVCTSLRADLRTPNVLCTHERVLVLTQNTEFEDDVVVLQQDLQSSPRLQLLLSFRVVAGRTLLAPMLVLWTGATPNGEAAWTVHNRWVCDLLTRTPEAELRRTWLQSLNREVGLLLEQLYTEMLSERVDPI